MRPLLASLVVVLLATAASADPLLITCTNRDEDGKKFEKSIHKLTIVMSHTADRERRLIRFLQTQELLENEPWRAWKKDDRKDGDVVNYTVYVTVTPNFVTFRMESDTETEKVFLVDGHASFAGMQALSGDDFRLKSLGDRITYERRPVP